MEEIETKEKILKGAEGLFSKYGIRSISMDDIARHLSVSKKTLYQHFADKDELVTIAMQTHMEEQRKVFEGIANEAENAIEELYKISGCLRKHTEESSPSLFFDIQKFHPKAWNVWVDFKDKFIRSSVARNLDLGIKEGYFRSEINTEIIACLRLAIIETCYDERVFPKGKFSIAEIQAQVFEHFVFGLCTEKGKKLYQKYKETNYKKQLNTPVI
ncbi:MAG TPA: TetR/AcrR family transcriptional regulator [Cyclobacteriaceae bacterium]|jgi:AcrR family transcriptional regulator|nr:TetR/AcrR family transcriptional regulator [Cyclobacteriaceae bacterium]